jgi:hypothetical protein
MTASLHFGLSLLLATSACLAPARGSRTSAYTGNASLIGAGLASLALSSAIGTCSSGDDLYSEDNGCGSLQNEGNGLFLGTGIILTLMGVVGIVQNVTTAEAAASAASK